jgi:hypothetical protein
VDSKFKTVVLRMQHTGLVICGSCKCLLEENVDDYIRGQIIELPLEQHCNAKQDRTGNKQGNPVMKGGLSCKCNCDQEYPGMIAG